MGVENSFSKSSHHYREVNIVQKLVAQKVVSDISVKDKSIVDLGAGDGEVYRQLNSTPKSFLAVDLSEKMLNRHISSDEVVKLTNSFDSETIWNELKSRDIDTIFSSSAFQWSKDLELLFKRLNEVGSNFSIALFTDETFSELHRYFNIDSPLYSRSKIVRYSEIFGESIEIEEKNYSLQFKSGRELLSYIRKSGVSGGINRLSVTELRSFIREEPFTNLSFSVVFIRSK